MAMLRYIELTPVRASMVTVPEEYRWSSYHANGIGKQIELCKPHEIYTRLGKTKPTKVSIMLGCPLMSNKESRVIYINGSCRV